MEKQAQVEILLPEDESPALNPIRVETVLSRLPVHRLARQGNIKIDLAEQNEQGLVTLTWKVSYNSAHGQPGPLAYKLDTLLINRKIEGPPPEALKAPAPGSSEKLPANEEKSPPKRVVPRLLKLGSLSEICRELQLADSGKNRADIKKALLQNASAFIEPNFKYKENDGTESTLDIGFTRYNVILTGTKLPNGKKATAVYISLSDVYLQVLKGAKTRPLDYDYLKKLSPAAQRFYEIISYKMYGTLTHDRPRVKLLYSECCARAPQKRHLTTKLMKLQMNRIHRKHQDSGYITDVVYQEFVGKDGLPDWVMLYKPGPKARAEFRAFQKHGGSHELDFEPPEAELPFMSCELVDQAIKASPLHSDLLTRGISDKSAAELLQRFSDETIARKIDVFDYMVERKDKRLNKSPSGYLYSSIVDNYSEPKGFIPKAERERQAAVKREADQLAAETSRRQRADDESKRRLAEQTKAYLQSCTPEQFAQLEADAIAQASEEMRRTLNDSALKRWRKTTLLGLVREHVESLIASGQLSLEPA